MFILFVFLFVFCLCSLNFIVSLASLCKETLETETPTISLQVSLRAARQDEFRHKGSHIDCFDARAGSCYGFLGVCCVQLRCGDGGAKSLGAGSPLPLQHYRERNPGSYRAVWSG